MVNLTRIYTRGGDAGDTSLGDGRRISKASARIAAYGTVDELNAHIGVLRTLELPDGWDALAGADPERAVRPRRRPLRAGGGAARPLVRAGAHAPARRHRARSSGSRRAATRSTTQLPPLTSFILPGGTPAAAQLHVCRTVCRRAERAIVALAAHEPVNPEATAYANRLSDLLFILARAANPPGSEPLWQPGASRPDLAPGG